MDEYADVFFPLAGIDRASSFDQQPKKSSPLGQSKTTPVGVNVRSFECLTERGRGGSRPGLRKYVPAKVNGTNPVQMLNFVISQSYDALPGDEGANEDEDAGVEWVDDWSTWNGPRRVPIPTGMVRRVPPGGSGAAMSRRRPAPVFRLTITADDETKPLGTTFEWDGDEYADSGLR